MQQGGPVHKHTGGMSTNFWSEYCMGAVLGAQPTLQGSNINLLDSLMMAAAIVIALQSRVKKGITAGLGEGGSVAFFTANDAVLDAVQLVEAVARQERQPEELTTLDPRLLKTATSE